jgi:cellulose synthase/poly-beta-1,6-N-acetylglucosamine synthase-like glycosyltransferase
MYRNYRYVLKKYNVDRNWYRPRTVMIVPCKGVDSAFEKNIASFFNQDYEDFLLWFVVADKDDPAYNKLIQLKKELGSSTKARDVQILVAGQSQSCSQKIHNLLCCYNKITDDIEVMAFADSDACIRKDWLGHIVYPLHSKKYGASSGYRWFVPAKNNPASLALSALNAKVAQLLGNTPFNQAWGGSMAITVDNFRKTGLDKIWANTISDDLSLTSAVKKAGMKIAYVPACLVASYETFSWKKLFEFGRRQFLITRVSAPKVWLFALFSNLYSILGLWAGSFLAIYAYGSRSKHLALFVAVPLIFFTGQLIRAILRQSMISKLLKDEQPNMKLAAAADILGFWLWSLLMLVLIIASAFGRTICWRGIKYKLISPAKTLRK